MSHSDTPPRSAETWKQIRDDYLAGVSGPVLVERYGVSLRTLRRRAGAECWRRQDDDPIRRHAAALEADAELSEVIDIEGAEQFNLLFDPTPHRLRRFAFRRTAEAAAIDRPQEAMAWLRLAEKLDRCGDRIDKDAITFRDTDHLRAAWLRRLGELPDAPSDGTP